MKEFSNSTSFGGNCNTFERAQNPNVLTCRGKDNDVTLTGLTVSRKWLLIAEAPTSHLTAQAVDPQTGLYRHILTGLTTNLPDL